MAHHAGGTGNGVDDSVDLFEGADWLTAKPEFAIAHNLLDRLVEAAAGDPAKYHMLRSKVRQAVEGALDRGTIAIWTIAGGGAAERAVRAELDALDELADATLADVSDRVARLRFHLSALDQ